MRLYPVNAKISKWGSLFSAVQPSADEYKEIPQKEKKKYMFEAYSIDHSRVVSHHSTTST